MPSAPHNPTDQQQWSPLPFQVYEKSDSKAHPDSLFPGPLLMLFILACVLHTWNPEAKRKVPTPELLYANSERYGPGQKKAMKKSLRNSVTYDLSACLSLFLCKLEFFFIHIC